MMIETMIYGNENCVLIRLLKGIDCVEFEVIFLTMDAIYRMGKMKHREKNTRFLKVIIFITFVDMRIITNLSSKSLSALDEFCTR